MYTLILIALIGFIAGGFIWLELLPLDFVNSIAKLFYKKKNTIKAQVKAVTNKKKVKGLPLLIDETKEIFKTTGKSDEFSVLMYLAVMGIEIIKTLGEMFKEVVIDDRFT